MTTAETAFGGTLVALIHVPQVVSELGGWLHCAGTAISKVKGVGPSVCPPGVMTRSVTTPGGLAGVRTVIWVAVPLTSSARALLNITMADERLVPLTTTSVPPVLSPLVGVKDEIVGGCPAAASGATAVSAAMASAAAPKTESRRRVGLRQFLYRHRPARS